MVLGLFKKKCAICGVEVNKESAEKKFGKYLCSEEHVEEYRKKIAEEESKGAKKGGGCC